MAKRQAITKQGLLDPEGAVIAYRRGLAWAVLERALRRKKLDTLAVRAAEITLDRYEPAPKWVPVASSPTLVNIRLELAEPRAELSAGGLAIHLTGDEHSQGNGRVRDTGRRQDVGGAGDDAAARETAP